ncbi:DUF72 domain-containing protein [Candidatus Parcubacteria bacterium]|nr:DUF72 domain-containing protein [Candidatus Parcubacteria bacterium]
MIRIGTSGWGYPHWKKGVFYPEGWKKHELEYYSQHFDTVEINSSFYHLPKPQTFKNWNKLTPKDFVFAVKGSRYITHLLKLDNARAPLETLLKNATLLGGKLGPILWQLPPQMELDFERLERFVKILPKEQRFAFEFRHPSWFKTKVYQLLKEHNRALVVADTPNYPLVKKTTADFAYLRLHGREKLYASNYTPEQLKGWGGLIKRWHTQGKDIFIFFDNDAQGYAPQNALQLKEILGPQLPS